MASLVLNLNTGLPEAVAGPGLVSATPPKWGFREMHSELRRLVNAWFKSGPNLVKLFSQVPELEQRTREGRTYMTATITGRGYMTWLPEIPDEDLHSQKDLALTHFIGLIANREWELLRPPCARCGMYFLRKSAKQKAYCSRTCSSASTAIHATRERRQRDQGKKIERAQELIEKWAGLRRKLGWKKWVAQKTGYTVHWLTRAHNKGRLRAPLQN
jgi:hypothetical protein